VSPANEADASRVAVVGVGLLTTGLDRAAGGRPKKNPEASRVDRTSRAAVAASGNFRVRPGSRRPYISIPMEFDLDPCEVVGGTGLSRFGKMVMVVTSHNSGQVCLFWVVHVFLFFEKKRLWVYNSTCVLVLSEEDSRSIPYGIR
jgi:hypothetical protein